MNKELRVERIRRISAREFCDQGREWIRICFPQFVAIRNEVAKFH